MELHHTPENPLPEGARCVALRTPDGIALRAMRAGNGGPRGTIVLIGGRGDFMERYFETMRDLIAMGFDVASVDLRGQGGSQRINGDPYRGYVKTFAHYDTDIRTLMRDLVLPACHAPYLALGHSTGGHILLRLLRRESWFTKVVLCSPLIGIVYGSWPRPIAATLVFAANLAGLGWMFLPGQNRRPLGRSDFSRNPLTSDPWRWNRDSGILERAPHLGLGGPTFAWLQAARRSVASIRAMGRRHELKSPVLILASGSDRVVDNDAIRALARRVPGIAACFVPGAQHELLSESTPVRRQFLAAFESFVEDV